MLLTASLGLLQSVDEVPASGSRLLNPHGGMFGNIPQE